MNKKSTYILRYYLPCEPIYKEDVTKRRGDEFVSYCLKNKIQAVMLYVDLNPYWYYAPDNLEHTKYSAKEIADGNSHKACIKNNIIYLKNININLYGCVVSKFKVKE